MFIISIDICKRLLTSNIEKKLFNLIELTFFIANMCSTK